MMMKEDENCSGSCSTADFDIGNVERWILLPVIVALMSQTNAVNRP
jgi:hypothetical protein